MVNQDTQRPFYKRFRKNGPLLASEVCVQGGLAHASQLSRILGPLVNEGLIKREKFGKNIWYSLAATGRLITGKYFRTEYDHVIETIFPHLINKLCRGPQKINDFISDIHADVAPSSLQSIIYSILAALKESGIVEETENGYFSLPMDRRGAIRLDISIWPELKTAITSIQDEYEQLKNTGQIDASRITSALAILNRTEAEIAADDRDQKSLQIKILTEKAKCYALQGNWRQAFSDITKARSEGKSSDFDNQELAQEIELVWSYVQVSCIKPLLIRIKHDIDIRDYISVRNILLEIYKIWISRRPLTKDTAFSTQLLDMALEVTTSADDLKQKLDISVEQEDSTTSPVIQSWPTRSDMRMKPIIT